MQVPANPAISSSTGELRAIGLRQNENSSSFPRRSEPESLLEQTRDTWLSGNPESHVGHQREVEMGRMRILRSSISDREIAIMNPRACHCPPFQ